MKSALAVGVAALVAALSAAPIARAADHRDGPAATAAPATDINDVYAWMATDAARVYLVMTVFPAATTASRFSDTAKYVFHLNSSAGYGMTQTETQIICTFDTAQVISCWVTRAGETEAYVTGDASGEAGIMSDPAGLRVFAGLRDDPFFFNLDGFNATTAAVASAAAGLTFDAANCPDLDLTTASTLVAQLSTAPGGGPAQDFFGALNTLAIVVTVDKTLVTPGGAILGVWGSTNQ